MKHVFYLYLLAFLFTACSDNPQSQKGGIWDETENSVAILVQDTSGHPLSGARILYIPLHSWHLWEPNGVNNQVDTFFSNSQGITNVPSAQWPANILLDSPKGMRLTTVYPEDSVTIIRAKAPANLKGNLIKDSSQALPMSVVIQGTPLSSPVHSDGSFMFPSLPEGTHTLVGLYEHFISPIGVVHLVSNKTQDSVFTLYLPKDDLILLEDFEDLNNQHRFGELVNSGWWYTSQDSLSHAAPTFIHQGILQSKDSWNQSHSLHMQFDVGEKFGDWYSMCGVEIEGNLSTLTHVQFLAKGSGTIQVQLIGMEDQLASYDMELDSTWTLIQIELSQFKTDVSIESILEFTTDMGFVALNNTQLWLDNISLIGVQPHLLYPSLQRNP